MKQVINEEVTVIMYYSASLRQAVPYLMHWQNKDYKLSAVDYYHSYMEGRDRQHIYELVDKDETLWFRLRLDSSTLHWTLEAIHDGLAD